MNNFENLKSMSVEELAEWLDKNGIFDNSPWMNWFAQQYCERCESIECKYAEAKEKLGIEPFFMDGTIECAYCEIYGNCQFFQDREDVPSNRDTIRMWLESEVKYEEV